MTTSTYKGRDVFNTTAGSLYVSMGGRDQEMTFGIGRIDYSTLYQGTAVAEAAAVRSAVAETAGTTVTAGPNQGAIFNLAHLPSDAVVAKEYGKAIATDLNTNAKIGLAANTTFIVKATATNGHEAYGGVGKSAKAILAKTDAAYVTNQTNDATKITGGNMADGDVLVIGSVAVAEGDVDDTIKFTQVNASSTAFKAGHEYEIVSMGSNTDGQTVDAAEIIAASNASGTLKVGTKFTVDANVSVANLAGLNALTQGMTFRMSTDTLTKDIEAMQGLVNTARVQAGSQYAAIESAVNYTTDLTAQYELGYNTVNDVNFSMETAHLAKNQILQQAATAMLAQANQGQQGLLQLIS
jgi:flagellin